MLQMSSSQGSGQQPSSSSTGSTSGKIGADNPANTPTAQEAQQTCDNLTKALNSDGGKTAAQLTRSGKKALENRGR